ncbi:hypothetical protein A8B78_09350 [Jannaschia sp. EhC01]|nr:hypothetical protein A8B78_09350 [Jannaschia sp. EhC01]
MEAVAVFLTCLFATFCAPDGTCTDRAPLPVTLDFGIGDQPIRLWTTPGATGRPVTADIMPPLPTARSEPLHLLARSAADGAVLLSLRDDPSDDMITYATLRLHPDRRGDPTGADALTSQAVCTQSFGAP